MRIVAQPMSSGNSITLSPPSSLRSNSFYKHDDVLLHDNTNDNNTKSASTNNEIEEIHKPDRDFNYTPTNASERAVPKGGVACPFPWRLHEMLKVAAEEGLQHVVSWAPHGKAFTVHQPSEFVEKIMTRYVEIKGS